jgi:hypothetical protein
MANGVSLHIGLNHVDPNAYNGWGGELAGCINDANAMKAIADSLGYTSTQLLNEQATASAVISQIGQYAQNCQSGDIVLLTYSGHGGLVPDPSGGEPGDNGQDSTWVLFDRMVTDDELYALWFGFQPGVRIFMLSDSCHSGTMARDELSDQLSATAATAKLKRKDVNARTVPEVKFRMIPFDKATTVYQKNKSMYQERQWAAYSAAKGDVTASLVLISGCQDNQTSADGEVNGLFTQNLLEVWNNGSFTGGYKDFYNAILAKMPATQTPNYFKVGVDNPTFEGQVPFTIGDRSMAGGVSVKPSGKPSVQGPASRSRDDAGPLTFTVSPGTNRYYVFEITSDASLFDKAKNGSKRSADNFYGSYADSTMPKRLTEGTFSLPTNAWSKLKAADVLYYRVITTSSPAPGWDNLMESVYDSQGASAPKIQITGTPAGYTDGPPADGTSRDVPAGAGAQPDTWGGSSWTREMPSNVVTAGS